MPMTAYSFQRTVFGRLRHQVTLLLYPDLRRIPEHEWSRALQRARGRPLDAVEIIGIVAGVVLVSWMTREAAPAASLIEATTLNVMRFFLAIPLLVLLCGPFLLRRTRRSLEVLCAERASASLATPRIQEIGHE